MNILHFAETPLAGSPLRIVKSCNALSTVSARLVALHPQPYGKRVFENDLCFHNDYEEVMDLLEKADILHFHNIVSLEKNPFQIDFLQYLSHKKMVQQFHSSPYFLAKKNDVDVNTIIQSPHQIPQLVIAQFQERYYPFAKIVPQIISFDQESDIEISHVESHCKIFYAPSSNVSAWFTGNPQEHWDTKGLPETQAVLSLLKKRNPHVEICIAKNIPHKECLAMRKTSHFNIDEMVTGSYHLSSLEGLVLGIPTVAYLDSRMRATLHAFTGSELLPWINCRLENSYHVIEEFLNDPKLRQEFGMFSRRWMEEYWNESDMVRKYIDVYNDLNDHPEIFNIPRIDYENKLQLWFSVGLGEAEWVERYKQQPVLTKLQTFGFSIISNVKKWLRSLLMRIQV